MKQALTFLEEFVIVQHLIPTENDLWLAVCLCVCKLKHMCPNVGLLCVRPSPLQKRQITTAWVTGCVPTIVEFRSSSVE